MERFQHAKYVEYMNIYQHEEIKFYFIKINCDGKAAFSQ